MATEKLVRDRIPLIIGAKGGEPDVRIASVAEYGDLLRCKLQEEVEEFLDSGETEELADILEVVHALADQAGVDSSVLEKIRNDKALERGAFAKRIVLRIDEA